MEAIDGIHCLHVLVCAKKYTHPHATYTLVSNNSMLMETSTTTLTSATSQRLPMSRLKYGDTLSNSTPSSRPLRQGEYTHALHPSRTCTCTSHSISASSVRRRRSAACRLFGAIVASSSSVRAITADDHRRIPIPFPGSHHISRSKAHGLRRVKVPIDAVVLVCRKR